MQYLGAEKAHGTSFEDTHFISLRLILRNRVCLPTQWFYFQFNGASISIPTGFFADISLHFWFIPPGWFIMLKPSGYLLWQNVYSVLITLFFFSRWFVSWFHFSCMPFLNVLDSNAGSTTQMQVIFWICRLPFCFVCSVFCLFRSLSVMQSLLFICAVVTCGLHTISKQKLLLCPSQ